jgi:hypothetical protein
MKVADIACTIKARSDRTLLRYIDNKTVNFRGYIKSKYQDEFYVDGEVNTLNTESDDEIALTGDIILGDVTVFKQNVRDNLIFTIGVINPVKLSPEAQSFSGVLVNTTTQ